jgi:hypothetical protein
MRSVAALLTILAIAAPASACINDREVDRHEREFKSNYLDPILPGSLSPEAEPAVRPLAYGGLGAALLLGAFFVRSRKSADS